MNKNYLILGLCGLLVFAACNKEIIDPNEGKTDSAIPEPTEEITTNTIVGISYEETPAKEAMALSSKVGYTPKLDADNKSVFGAIWTKADVIYVTTATGTEGEEPQLTAFTLLGEGGEQNGTFKSETPITGKVFSAVYSAAIANITEDKKHVEVVFPSEQTYVEKGLASHTIPMYAVGTDPEALKFKYGSGVLRLNLSSAETKTLTKIEIVTTEPASGTFYADFANNEKFPSGYPGGAADSYVPAEDAETPAAKESTVPEYVITYNIPDGVVLTEEPTEFNIALAASAYCTDGKYTKVTARAYTSDGQVMEASKKSMEILAGAVHDFKELDILDNITPYVELVRSTSSTLTYRWSTKKLRDKTHENYVENKVEDYKVPYKIALYEDMECTQSVVSWTLPVDEYLYRPFAPEGNDAYGGYPAFTFSGLDPEKEYFCKVTDENLHATSMAVSGITAKSLYTELSETDVPVGGTVIAEDFSEFVWGGDFVTPAAGYTVKLVKDKTFSKATGDNDKNFILAKCSVDHDLFNADKLRAAVKETRLADWAYIGEGGNLYSYAGYLRMGNGKMTSEVVTPVLKNLQENRLATLTVKFKAAPYHDTNKPEADPDDIHIQIITGGTVTNGKLTGHTATVAKTFKLEGQQNTWKEYSFDIPNVTSDSRISIGAYRPKDAATGVNRRMYIDDIEITVKDYVELKAELQGATSSTLSFKWTQNKYTDSEADCNHRYTIALYKDQACTDKVISWEPAKKDGAYKTTLSEVDIYHQPAFNFSGLTPNTTYYFKVTDRDTKLTSKVIPGTTESFTSSPVSSTAVTAGQTILAEDFSELLWGGDFVYKGIGYIADTYTGVPFSIPTESNKEDYGLSKPSVETGLFADTGDPAKGLATAVSTTRLKDWGYVSEESSMRIFARPGHVKVGSGSKWARIVTPELSSLTGPATVEVSFKASPYYDHDQQHLADPFDACITVLKGTSREDGTANSARIGLISKSSEVTATKFQLKDEKNKWNTYTFTIPGVTPDSRISIGTYRTSNGKQQRMYIDDVVIKVKEYETEGKPTVRLLGATSSTLTFQWSVNGFTDITADCKRYAKAALYKDEACSSLVVSWTIDDLEKYNSKQPAFTFSGLDSNTTYYFKVTDMGTDKVEGQTSAVVSGNTSSFTPVTVVAANKVEVGGTVLAEDFSELLWYGDDVTPGVSYVKSSFDAFVKASGENPSGYSLYKPGGDKNWCNDASLQKATGKTRLADWQHTTNETTTNPRMFYRAGYVKLGVTKYWGRIITPQLSNLKGKAKVKISFKACPYGSAARDLSITIIENAGTSDAKKFLSRVAATTEVEAKKVAMKTTINTWTKYEYEIDNVTPTSRISIGGAGVYSDQTTADRRMFIDEIVITVVSYNE